MVCVVMSDEDIVRRVHELMNCGSFRSYKQANRPKTRKTLYGWYGCGEEVFLELYDAINPWLGERRIKQFETIWERWAQDRLKSGLKLSRRYLTD